MYKYLSVFLEDSLLNHTQKCVFVIQLSVVNLLNESIVLV